MNHTATPVPHFVLFANRAANLPDSYLRYVKNMIRRDWLAPGVPFHMTVRGKAPKEQKRRIE